MTGGQEPRNAEDAGIEWYLAREGQQYGPLSDLEMRKLVEFGHLKAADLVWRAGFSDWTAAATAFPDAQRAKPPPPPPPPPRATPKPALATSDGADRNDPAAPREPAPQTTADTPAPREAPQQAAHDVRQAHDDGRQPAERRTRAPGRASDPDTAGDHDTAMRPDATPHRTSGAATAPGEEPTQPAWAAAAPRPAGRAPTQRPTGVPRPGGGVTIAWPDGDQGARAPSQGTRPQPASEAPAWPGAGPVPQARPQPGPDARSPHGQQRVGPARQPAAYHGQDPANAPDPRRAHAPAGYAPEPNWSLDDESDGPPHPNQGGGRRSGGRSRRSRNGDPDGFPDTGAVVDEEHYEPEGRRGGLVLTLVLVLLVGLMGAGAYGLYTEQIAPDLAASLKAKLGLAPASSSAATTGRANQPVTSTDAAPAPATVASASANIATQPPSGPTFPGNAEAFDAQLQTSAMWQMIKTDFPAWYQERLKEAARRAAENQDALSIQRYLLESLVALRRENARHAYAAGLPQLKAIADAFRNNLVNLARHGDEACYTFISRGEGARVIADLYPQPRFGPLLEAQMVAVLAAVREGQRRPITTPSPRKEDYALLSTELQAMGWSEEDLKLFADADGLARAEPAKVCNMVTDWFSAHLKLADANAQQRLLAESIRPVVGG